MSSSTERMRKARSLNKKYRIAAEHDIKIHTDVIVIEYPDGYLRVQQWDGNEWVTILEK